MQNCVVNISFCTILYFLYIDFCKLIRYAKEKVVCIMKEIRFTENVSVNTRAYIDTINFSYHINSFEWPTMHSHKDYWEFTIVLEGTMNNYTQKGKASYPSGSVLVSTTMHSHFILNASKEPLRYANLMVKEAYITKILEFLAPDVLEELLQGKSQFFLKRRIMHEIESTFLNVNLEDPKKIKRNEELLRSALLMLLSSLVISADFSTEKTSKWVANLNKIIRENDYLKLTTNDLCAKLGYSRSQLTILFKKHFKKTPHDYLMNLKFEHATFLLLNSDATIADIADKLGYASPAAFYSAFRKVYGITPHEYKKQLQASTKDFHNPQN